jgi:Tfp pilus assembly PilM family ATPase
MLLGTQTGWIGVDIGSQSIKLAQVERSGPTFRVREGVVLPRSTSWQGDDLMSRASSREEIGAAIEAGHKFRGDKVACVLPSYLYDSRPLHLPAGSPSERRAMVAHELATVRQGSHATSEFDFWEATLHGRDGGPCKSNVNTLSLDSGWGDQVVRDTAQLGLRCQVLDGPPMVLARSIKMMSPRNSNRPIAALDWGYRGTSLGFLFEGQPLYTRQINRCGYHHIVENVQRGLGVSLDQAQHLLTQHGLPDLQQRDTGNDQFQEILSEMAAQTLHDLAEEVNRTLTYIDTQHPGLFPEQIVLFGGGATMKNAAAHLTKRVRLEIQPWHLSTQNKEKSVWNAPSSPLLGAAIGLSSLAWAKG